MQWFVIIPFLFSTLLAAFPQEEEAKILYWMHLGDTQKGVQRYLDVKASTKEHDFELLQNMGKILLEEGAQSDDAECQLMAIFGAGVAKSHALIGVLEKGIASKEIKIQLAALNFLSKLQEDEADDLLIRALSSPFLLVRLEALYQLAEKKEEAVIEHLDALLVKVPHEVAVVFPQILTPLETPAATRRIRHFLSDSSLDVRVGAILSIAESKRDDLLPHIRSLALHPEFAQQEAAAYALGILKDQSSLPLLRTLATRNDVHVQLAAYHSLYLLGEEDALKSIEALAAQRNLFAIALLGNFETDLRSSILGELSRDVDPSVRINALYALLRNKDARCVPGLTEILIRDDKDLGFMPQSTPGRSLTAIRVVSSASAHAKTNPTLLAKTLNVREVVLRKTLELSDDDFLKVASVVLEKRQFDLIPNLVELLQNQQSEKAIALLKKHQQRAGIPLIRHYCNLALFRLREPGPYEETLVQWVKEAHKNTLIRFRDSPVKDFKGHHSPYILTPEETSQLLVSAFEALASAQNELGIEALLHAIAYGNEKNKYALAGLLMKTTE